MQERARGFLSDSYPEIQLILIEEINISVLIFNALEVSDFGYSILSEGYSLSCHQKLPFDFSSCCLSQDEVSTKMQTASVNYSLN